MVEGRGELRLAQEPAAEIGLAESRRQQLQRRRAAESDVLRAVDDARPAASERLDDAIPAELGPDPTVRLHAHEL